MKNLIGLTAICGLMLISASCVERVDMVRSGEETALQVLSITQTPGWAQDVWISGQTAYIADGEQGIAIWDITQKDSPIPLDTLITDRSVTGVKYSPMTGLIFVGMPGDNGGVTYYNLDTKDRRSTLFDDGLAAFSILEISNDTVIVAEVDRNLGEGLRIFAIYYDAVDGSPEDSIWYDRDIRASLSFESGSGRGLHWDSGFAYVAINQAGLTIAEVVIASNSISITKLGNADTPGGARDVALNRAKTHAIVADYQAGISIIDVTDKSAPVYIKSLLPDGVDQMFRVSAVGDTAYALDNNNGMFVFDVTNPTDIRLIGRYDSPKPRGLFITDDHTIFLADELLGLVILNWRN